MEIYKRVWLRLCQDTSLRLEGTGSSLYHSSAHNIRSQPGHSDGALFPFPPGLDPRLRNIIGFLPSTERLYGTLVNSPNSYAVSDKPYSKWYLIDQRTYDAAAASDGFVNSVTVPFISKTGFSYSDPDNHDSSEYATNGWAGMCLKSRRNVLRSKT